jgi:hypothetical protein
VLLSLFLLAALRGAEGLVVDTAESYMASLWLAKICPCTLLCLVPYCTPGMVGGVVLLPSKSQLV